MLNVKEETGEESLLAKKIKLRIFYFFIYNYPLNDAKGFAR